MKVIDRERWRVLEPLLDQALELSMEEQAIWLQELRTTAPELAAELDKLLSGEAAADADGFLVEPLELPLSAAPLEGAQLGAYTLERPLGEGGMGSVWLARRADGRFEGRAAVKLLNLALLSVRGQQRFRREGSMLARLAHPGIARLLDAGVAASGQPYLVIEHVEGMPIDVFADTRCLTLVERIRLVLQVLSAVGHAHANLIVHRDLKPSNILVTGEGAAKLLDFGIAKLLAAEGDEQRTAVTAAGGRALTPDFAAPEQVRGGAITTATDVYAIGVLLYTLLTGRRPYDLAGRSAAEIERIICESEPAKPSATFADGAPARNDASERARTRGGSPDRIRRQLQGDLDAIVMKALRKEPERRYPWASSLAEDLQRFLDGHPVVARPDSARYRLRKFIGRHRWGLAASAAFVFLLSAYLVTVTVQRKRIQRALAQATVGARKAEQVSDFMLGLFEASEQGKAFGDTVSARELLNRGIVRARGLSAQPEVQAQMLDVIGRLHAQLGEYEQSRRILEEALSIRRRVLGANHAEVATSLENLGSVLVTSGDYRAAATSYREALAIRRRTLADTRPQVLDALYNLGLVLHKTGDQEAARPIIDEWMAAVAKLGPDSARADQLMALGEQLQFRGQRAQAEQLYRHALNARRALFGERDPSVASGLDLLGGVLSAQGKLEEAERTLTQAVALQRALHSDGHPELAKGLVNLGHTLQRQQRWVEAESLFREALAMDRRFLGADHLFIGTGNEEVGRVLANQGDYVQAEPFFREAIRIYRSHFDDRNLMVIRARMFLGDALRGAGALSEAESLLLAGYTAFRDRRGFGDEPYDFAREALARLYDAQGRTEEAAKYRR